MSDKLFKWIKASSSGLPDKSCPAKLGDRYGELVVKDGKATFIAHKSHFEINPESTVMEDLELALPEEA